MTNDKIIVTDDAPQPVGTYPHARQAGNLLFLSGIGPRPAGGGPLPGVTLNDSGKVVSIELKCIADVRKN